MSKVIEPDDLEEFSAWSVYLRGRIKAAKRAELGPNALLLRESTYGATRFYCYDYYAKLSEAGLVQSLEEYLALQAPHPGPQVGGALAVLNLVECNSNKELLTPSRRSRTAKDLEFALECRINPALILGFLAEVGSSAMARDLSSQSKRLSTLTAYLR